MPGPGPLPQTPAPGQAQVDQTQAKQAPAVKTHQANQVHPNQAPQADKASKAKQPRVKLGEDDRRRFLQGLARGFLAVLLIMIILFVTVLILVRMDKNQPNKIEYRFLQNEPLYREYHCEAMIIRDEQPYPADQNGTFTTFLPQGARVNGQENIGFIVPDPIQNTYSSLLELEHKIIKNQLIFLQNQDNREYQKIVNETEGQIGKLWSDIFDSYNPKNLQVSQDRQDNLRMLLHERNQQLINLTLDDQGSTTVGNDDLQDYLRQKKQLQRHSLPIFSKASGNFIRTIDGFETMVDVDKLTSYTPDQLYTFFQEAPKTQSKVVERAEQGKALYKISRGMYQYFVCYLPPGTTKYCEEGDTIRAEVADYNIAMEQLLCLRSEETAQGALMIFKTSEALGGLADLRMLSLQIFLDRSFGLKVPLSALIDYTPGSEKAQVMKVVNGFVHKIPVRVLAENGSYAIIASVQSEVDKWGRTPEVKAEVSQAKAQQVLDKERLAKVIKGQEDNIRKLNERLGKTTPSQGIYSPDETVALETTSRRTEETRSVSSGSSPDGMAPTGSGRDGEDATESAGLDPEGPDSDEPEEPSSATATTSTQATEATTTLSPAEKRAKESERALAEKLYLGESSIIIVNPGDVHEGDQIEE